MSDLQPPVTPIEPAPQASDGAVAPQPPVEAPAATPPEQPRSRRGLWIGLIVGGAVLLLIIIGLIVTTAVLASQRTPEAVTSRFVDALIAGDDAAALATLEDSPGGPGYFLAEGVYAGATDTISDYRVLDSSRQGTTAAVTVELQQGDEVYTARVPLVKTGRDFLFFDRWAINPDVLPKARIINPRPAGMGLLINGVDTPAFTGGIQFDLRALPGTYTLEATGGGDLYGAEPVSAPLLLGAADNVNIDVSIVLTEAGIAAAQQAVDAQFDGCIAQASPKPGPGCGFFVTGTDGLTLTSMTWTITTRPTVSFEPYDGSAVLSAGWPVESAGAGSLKFSASGPDGSGDAFVGGVNQQGVIVFRDGVAEFISSFTD